MTTMILSTPAAQNETVLIDVQVKAEVISSDVARRKATVFLGMHVGNLLRADNPELLLSDPLIWRMDVILTSPSVGTVMTLGSMKVNALTGKVQRRKQLTDQLTTKLHALTND